MLWNNYINFDYKALTDNNNLPYMNNYKSNTNTINSFNSYHLSISNIISSSTPHELLDELIKHFNLYGYGELAKYIAFTWSDGLVGIDKPDKVKLDNLIGLDFQKKALLKNTEAFLNGVVSNNVLLCGDSGTGKSSCVKALLNKYHLNGLRIIEFPRYYLKDLHKLFKLLADKKNKYIIFLDDLSFEADDIEYKYLKAVIDGQVEPQPDNVLIYATSNRRHLIKETWADRQTDGEIHARDLMQEKMSLAERFGIRLIFTSPSQNEYLNIVESILAQKGVEMNEEIKRQAIIWEMSYNGRSGRTAKQFVGSIIGEGK